MDLKFTVFANVSRPPAEVFEAVVNPDILSEYFTTGGAKGRLEAGAQVTWDFADFPGAFPVDVIEVVPNEKIVLRWEAGDGREDHEAGTWERGGYQTTVTMTFKPLDDGARTMVEITEEGWRETEGGLQASYGNCMGWSQMLAAMKAWVEHRINLREGMYK